MNKRIFSVFILTIILNFQPNTSAAQSTLLTLKDAIKTGLANFGTLKAKSNYIGAAKANVEAARREYLPDLTLSLQQNYGTINGQSGPLFGYRGLAVASAGPSLQNQNWKSAFGALYLANIQWDFFSFGRMKERVNVASAELALDRHDLEQEIFQHKVRIAAAYLNLLAAKRLSGSQENNLLRAAGLQFVVQALAKNGLIAGVDSSLANAEVSAGRITLTRAKDFEQEQAAELSRLMGITDQNFALDTFFVNRMPSSLADSIIPGGSRVANHPLLQFFQSRVNLSDQRATYLHKFIYPTFSFFSILQTRGSGFDYNYGFQFPDAYTTKYFPGIQPHRGNYLTGIGVIWNLTSSLRIQQQVAAQKFTSKALMNESEVIEGQLQNQVLLANVRLKNALQNYREVPIQLKAAADAYLQKSVLYKNGLSNIVEVTQALYAINRAETDRDIVYTNLWQALLLKAAAIGDLELFINQL
ncbi:MAG: TolC family protein [Chitinophagaceae bacterium]